MFKISQSLDFIYVQVPVSLCQSVEIWFLNVDCTSAKHFIFPADMGNHENEFKDGKPI